MPPADMVAGFAALCLTVLCCCVIVVIAWVVNKNQGNQKETNMPEISRFLGIVISMYFDEHNPPHFHVQYNEYRASIDINNLNISAGWLPARVRGLVEEWAELHRAELLAMWETADFHRIQPLV